MVGVGIILFYSLPQTNGSDTAQSQYLIDIFTAESVAANLVALRKLEKTKREIKKEQDIAIITGGIIISTGGLLHIFSNRWLKRPNIKPSENRIGIKIEF